MAPKVRPNNRLLVLCTSINDVTAWPFWKFLQLKKVKGVTDMAFLAFNSDGGSFEARIDGEKYSLKNYATVKGYREEMLQSFLERFHDPGRSYLIYGGHGMGDYLELEQYKLALQAHELARLLDKRRFEAILFDACFMSNLDCAYHLRHNTRFIGACEGYMWEPDTALDYHVFNTFTASALSRFRDPKLILETIQREYTSKAPRGDFSVIDTTHVAELRRYVADNVVQRVYNHATLYSPVQQERLSLLAETALEESVRAFGQPGGDAHLPGLLTRKLPASEPNSPDELALANSRRLRRRDRIAQAIQFEHSLYPSESGDKHLVDLKSYLIDMALEEESGCAGTTKAAKGNWRVPRKAAAGAWTPSRACDVDAHGTLPPPKVLAVPLGTQQPSPSPSPSSSSPVQGADVAAPDPALSNNSAAYGLELFGKVVLSHVGPRASGIYAARLGGLSLSVHEYSAMSVPAEPWRPSRTILNKKVKAFLSRGALEEVTMARGAAPRRTAAATPPVVVDAARGVAAAVPPNAARPAPVERALPSPASAVPPAAPAAPSKKLVDAHPAAAPAAQRSHSVDEVHAIKRAAAEAAQLVNRSVQ